MIAKVILVPKPNSFQFDDRILLLEEPVKVLQTRNIPYLNMIYHILDFIVLVLMDNVV
jgi:hypothetical protein